MEIQKHCGDLKPFFFSFSPIIIPGDYTTIMIILLIANAAVTKPLRKIEKNVLQKR